MKYLLDTMVWLWSVSSARKIGPDGLKILQDGGEEIYLSASSSWEIAIKAKSGKVTLPEPPGRYLPKRLREQGIRSLPITQNHTLRVDDLPLYHNDPFDRILIAQAIEEQMVILTADRTFREYPIQLIWCGR